MPRKLIAVRLISHPVLCNYYVTYRCNAACSFCDIWERPSPYVTLANAEQNLHDLRRLGVRVVDFTGGEPLLHRQIDQLLALAKRQKLITTLTTNGLLYPKWAERLRGKVDMLHFSLDYADAERHNAARGVACFDKVMESIQIARALGERPDILFTAFPDNLDHIGRVWEEVCLPNDLVLILNPVFSYGDVADDAQLNADALATLRAWGKRKNVYLNEAFLQLRTDGGNHTAAPVCRAGSTTVVISPENTLVLPCYHLGQQEFPIENQLYHLYRTEAVQRLVAQEGRLPACEGCTINCYMQPSFAVEMNRYWWKALPSTLKYNYMKGTWKQLFAR
ncbi:Radical SAM superfamily enzyme, MoaA/NifB/PqqE/SkfB family [Catalinimonas alkaloidigena]|uniref:Radical SAM superfamily enzyme, MoaA/NifB/PqqE/SkfB family n=1 Tax=Catalinimonas alkaloidigena TaxID=1075417 RepID=A0A1G9M129_9BACT|nr:Radical SAM superfamily enzyme, MoaA/NifB/PqqE/SkfB family [Catalinimonas alkaloidigena]